MKIISACIFGLKIPFVEIFRHNLFERDCSDSVIVKLVTDTGLCGFGEGVPRPYVTGEDQESCMRHIAEKLLPAVIGQKLDGIDTEQAMVWVDSLLGKDPGMGMVAWNAARAAVELAFLDCLLRARGLSMGALLPAKSNEVVYSGVIGAAALEQALARAQRCREAGFKFIKLKVSRLGDVALVGAVRNILGSSVSLRLDANRAFSFSEAKQFLSLVKQYNIECIEEPLCSEDVDHMSLLRKTTSVPVMADESLLSLADAEGLIRGQAVDFVNLRLSKCGGLYRTLMIAKLARSSGIGIQLGCQVGETAILSAAGRHLAAHLGKLKFVEGSYSTLLLSEDIAQEDVNFGFAGRAPILDGLGLGVTVRPEIIGKYCCKTILLN